jgi:oligosaccharide repeat unit polymerase
MNLFFNFLFIFIGIFIFRKSISIFNFGFNHVTVFSVVWVFVIIGSQLSSYADLSLITLFVVYVSWYFYLFGSLTIFSTIPLIPKLNARACLTLMWVLYMLFVLFNYNTIFDFFNGVTSIETLASSRVTRGMYGLEFESNPLKTIFGNNISILWPLTVALFLLKKLRTSYFVLITTTIIISLLSNFTRAPFLFLFVSYLFIHSYIFNKINVRLVLIFVIILLSAFLFSSYYLTIASSKISSQNIDDSLSEGILLYVFGGIFAFQNLLNGLYLDSFTYDIRLYSFDFLNYILKSINLISSYPSIIREYDTIYVTNVYTYLDCFVLDFGILGALLGSFFLGVVSSLVFKRFARGSFIGIILYTNIIYYSSFIFMNNEFIRFSFLLLIIKLVFLSMLFKLIKHPLNESI